MTWPIFWSPSAGKALYITKSFIFKIKVILDICGVARASFENRVPTTVLISCLDEMYVHT